MSQSPSVKSAAWPLPPFHVQQVFQASNHMFVASIIEKFGDPAVSCQQSQPFGLASAFHWTYSVLSCRSNMRNRLVLPTSIWKVFSAATQFAHCRGLSFRVTVAIGFPSDLLCERFLVSCD
jgi:hypothetical protein